MKNSTLYIVEFNFKVHRGQKSRISAQNWLFKHLRKFYYFMFLIKHTFKVLFLKKIDIWYQYFTISILDKQILKQRSQEKWNVLTLFRHSLKVKAPDCICLQHYNNVVFQNINLVILKQQSHKILFDTQLFVFHRVFNLRLAEKISKINTTMVYLIVLPMHKMLI